ncbi:carbohydrate-binding module family 18 protein [Dothidotthia symphoricarpi CBS 119687]|uniref:Carbohydrate-binding module family 18 protein n=1 Tax=Dothidotthia symphoricarpi CBS 119687 TaxID=1392245 RepID=A0A6A6ARP7_9PLEO|nr:carbohydrate-binding module family 18 protein [Dothidotthia symphoricarpi CBS 119687]KAF2133517.1 carbohydrate-binding module family 18 protein [Dothidotthia symphoricarpi CBS 119687]
MPSLLPLLTLLALALTASAANSIKFINHCPHNIYFWTVGPGTVDPRGHDWEHILVPGSGGSVVHGMVNTELLGGGFSLKMRDVPRYEVAPAGIIQVEYHLEPTRNRIWYDLSAINCNHAAGNMDPAFCPLIAGGLRVHVPGRKEGQCPPAWCSGGGCFNTYLTHGSWLGEPTFACDAGVDIMVETCTEGVGPRTFDGQIELPVESAPVQPGMLSLDGSCGVKDGGGGNGYVCAGSRWGECCSEFGFCGNSPVHCAAGCQNPFGTCTPSSPMSDYDYMAAVAVADIEVETARVTATKTTMQTIIATETRGGHPVPSKA